MIRQGDVLLLTKAIPAEAKKIALRPIALGERTGHHHSLMADDGVMLDDVAEMYEVGSETYLRITGEGVALVHQQHKAHRLAPGDYIYRPQVENSDWGTRPVVD